MVLVVLVDLLELVLAHLEGQLEVCKEELTDRWEVVAGSTGLAHCRCSPLGTERRRPTSPSHFSSG